MPNRIPFSLPALTLGTLLSLLPTWAAATGPAVYPEPRAAVQALLAAVAAPQGDALRTVLGSEVDDLGSGDPVADQADRLRFARAAAEATKLEAQGDDRYTLLVGEEQHPFAIPLVRGTGGWHFATDQGKQELVNRRIGRNELRTIATLRAYVDAQYEYASEDRTGSGRQFARRLYSTPGQRDGLYWEAAEGEPGSPMGPLVAEAAAEGYATGSGPGTPYHGYLYKELTAQGDHAPGGAGNFLDQQGRMTRGFGLLAYPAGYGESGIMSFMVNQRGLVYQTDLGADTAAKAAAIDTFDPGPGWDPVLAE